MLNNIKKIIKKKLTLETPELIFSNDENGNKNLNHSQILSFGNDNPDKIFYVIKRTPGTGLFSNVVFVLNHLLIAEKFGFIPIIDMENYKTIYSEKKKIFNTNNSWEYYFNNVSKFKLKEVYSSKKVIITSDKFFNFFEYDMESNIFQGVLNKYLKIKSRFNKIIKKIYKKNFGKKTLGVHFRGTSYKQSAGHPFPATPCQMINLVKKIIKNDQITKIFLSTEERKYLEIFKKEFPDKLIYINSCYRSNKNDAFKIYPRNNHRYKLGREILIETFLLSKCDSFIYLNSNVSSAAMAFNLNKNQKRYKIDNGFNSKNIFYAMFLWHVKKNLPEFLGGFKKNIKIHSST